MPGQAGRQAGSGAPDHVTIVRCGQVLAPDALGARDLVIAGERLVAVAEPGVEIAGWRSRSSTSAP